MDFESRVPFLLAGLEIPAIQVGILLARGFSSAMRIGAVAHEVFPGKDIVLPVGGLLIGWASGPEGPASAKPLCFDRFTGVLAARASSIAVPAAMRIAVPGASPALSSAAAPGIRFPFSVLIGIPLDHAMATHVSALTGTLWLS